MGKGIKGTQKKPKISKNVLNNDKGRKCLQFPTFSFRYITTNAKYNFDFFSPKAGRKKEETIYKLYSRIEEISQKDWSYWGSLDKTIGYETIPYSLINFSPSNKNLTGDENIYIFRVKAGKNSTEARILGFKENGCPIYHIIGYDFDFSAYNHGS